MNVRAVPMVGVAIVAGLVGFLAANASSSARRVPERAPPLSAIEARLDRLEELLTHTPVNEGVGTRYEGALLPLASTCTKPAEAPASRDSVSPAAVEPPEEADSELALARAEAHFQSSTGASDWGRMRESGLRSLTVSGGRIDSVECRGSICRLETRHQSRAEAEQFIDSAELSPLMNDAMLSRFPKNAAGTEFVLFVTPAMAAPPLPKQTHER